MKLFTNFLVAGIAAQGYVGEHNGGSPCGGGGTGFDCHGNGCIGDGCDGGGSGSGGCIGSLCTTESGGNSGGGSGGCIGSGCPTASTTTRRTTTTTTTTTTTPAWESNDPVELFMANELSWCGYLGLGTQECVTRLQGNLEYAYNESYSCAVTPDEEYATWKTYGAKDDYYGLFAICGPYSPYSVSYRSVLWQ